MNPEAFKQAQSRGWMEGWTVYVQYKKEGYLLLNHEDFETRTLSLNDILFGTDFCEKYYGKYLYQTMMQRMLFLGEKERIEFLEKHLEVKDSCYQEIDTSKTHHTCNSECDSRVHVQHPEVKEESNITKEETKIYSCIHESAYREDGVWHCNDCNGEFHSYMSSLQSDRSITKLQKQIDAIAKDCKLNRN